MIRQSKALHKRVKSERQWQQENKELVACDKGFPRGGGGELLGTFGGGAPSASPNPDSISDQKMPVPTPVLTPGLKNSDPFSDLTL